VDRKGRGKQTLRRRGGESGATGGKRINQEKWRTDNEVELNCFPGKRFDGKVEVRGESVLDE